MWRGEMGGLDGSASNPHGCPPAACWTAVIRSFNSSIRSMRMSRTEEANHGSERAKSWAARTQVTALISSPPKYTLPCCKVKPCRWKTQRISKWALLYRSP